MRLGPLIPCELFGRVQISPVQRVIEIDSASNTRRPVPVTASGDVIISADALATIQSQMVIVIACMDEDVQVIEGVLSGIPHDCLVIIVSNSSRSPVDNYGAEVALLEEFCAVTQRAAMIIHQKDPEAAEAFRQAGMPELVSSSGTIHPGKGEAMIIGMALAALTKRKYIGYVDADNFVPGSVNEYCRVFAAGLYAAKSPRAMVRISWNSKPKVRDGRLCFDKRGRSSIVVNEWFNKLLNEYTDDPNSELIVTGNAGEHAMTLELGLKLRLAGGFAIEPYELLNILEQYGKSTSKPSPAATMLPAKAGVPMTAQATPVGPPVPSLARSDSGIVQVLQIETRNPHFHDSSKGEGHVRRMQMQGLNVLYHSPLTPKALRAELAKFMEDQEDLLSGERPPCAQIYPPVGNLDFGVFFDLLTSNSTSFRQFLPESMPMEASLISRL
ncbi:putative mannosyl-3-phosphoglycerate synthase [Microdochium trichocladiopsis]|uniref:Mannosyl-3-phosphoglycerate synthase n=1 Tax=Microdochium trichocladiopsis TaxID=1682393 RepID=A0A9P9BV32_9PEZI|nr:putative mannosyl-3-phosphoglycerate synthase [Microdochium trichocladiopsis]KAH7039898.1 putative mannosyl-3-phosphoglycerate synthase [Microdochium trichocladiopsis]